MEIIWKPNSTGHAELFMDYGGWGRVWIRLNAEDNLFLDWDTDYVQDFYATREEVPYLTVEFVNNTMTLFLAEEPFIVYYKDQRMVDLPATPWSSDSCGPINYWINIFLLFAELLIN